MYFSNVYNVGNSFVQSEDSISEFPHFYNNPKQHEHSSSTNSSHTSSIQDSCYDYSSWATEQIRMKNYSLMKSPTECCDVFQPDSVSPPGSVTVSKAISSNRQITNLVNNIDVFTDIGHFNNQMGREHETNQFNSGKTQIEAIELDAENLKATSPLGSDDERVPWLRRPVEFSTNSPLWSLLWRYGIQYLGEVSQKRFRKGKDYTDQISSLVNIHNALVTQPFEYQILTPSGRVWQELDIYYEANFHIETDESSQRSACVSVLCDICPFKTLSSNKKGLLEHIYRLLNVKYRCLYCGSIFNSKSDLLSHSEATNERRKGPENLYDVPTSACIVSRRSLHFEIEEIQDFENRFLEWTRLLITAMKLNGHLLSQPTEMLMEQVKREIDYNFIDLYKKIDRLDISKKRYSQRYLSVRMGDDQFCSFIYWTKKLTNTDQSKSAMFRIVEKKRKKAISIHQLLDIKSDTLRKGDNKCHYDGCRCGGLYTSPHESTLTEHVLTSNLLIVCVACKIGFTVYDNFEQHLSKANCFIPRIL